MHYNDLDRTHDWQETGPSNYRCRKCGSQALELESGAFGYIRSSDLVVKIIWSTSESCKQLVMNKALK